MAWTIHHADVLDALRAMPENSADAMLSDVPYGLGSREPTAEEVIAYLKGEELHMGGDFMAKDWKIPSVKIWQEVLRVVKPGAPVLAFGGSRTFDLIGLGMRVAGLQGRDCIAWMYGSGFPKSLNVAKALDGGGKRGRKKKLEPVDLDAFDDYEEENEEHADPPAPAAPTLAKIWTGYGTALKPAWEPCLVFRKPMDGTVAHNVKVHGVGGLNAAGCSIGRAEGDKASGWSQTGSEAGENVAMSGANYARDPKPDAPGRWPANVALDEEAAGALDASCPTSKSPPAAYQVNRKTMVTGVDLAPRGKTETIQGYADSGGPSRFFYTAKASREERDLGCSALRTRTVTEAVGREEGSAGAGNARAGAGRNGGAKNHHPCVKPIALMRWLSRLMLPPARQGDTRRIIVPYSGSGSEMIGALLAGWDDVIGIELEAEYIEIAQHRLALAASNPRAFEALMEGELQRGEKIDPRQVSMF